MTIQQLTRERLFAVTETQRRLQPGQITQGEILKIYPNNKAQIQLGTQTMVAQLEASLSIGERYHFQVQSTDEFIHLKVIGDRLTKQTETNARNLLNALSLKVNNEKADFVQTLMNEKVPFDRKRLVQAFKLMEQMDKKSGAKDIIRQIFARGLPLETSVFKAIHATRVNGFSDEMKGLLHQLRQVPATTPLHQTLVNQLSQLIERPAMTEVVFAEQILSGSTSEQQHLLSIVKNLSLIDKHIDLTSWQHSLLTSAKEKQPPLQTNEVNLRQALRQMNTNGVRLQVEAQQFLEKWGQLIQRSATTDTPLTEKEFSQIKNKLTRNILPFLTTEHGDRLQSISNNRMQMTTLHTLLQTLSNEQTFTKTDQLLTAVKQQEMFLNSSIKEQLLIQIQQVLSSTGLSYEHTLLQNMAEEEQVATIKSLLIQLTQQADGTLNERAQQLLHLINGLQLQSMNESNNFIQASLLVPGEKLHLNNDLYLDFESKKKADGKVDPDYCRILFYLDLSNLKETIIDMNIQKRLVTITIFNEYGLPENGWEPLQQTLRENLSLIDYQLFTVSFKPLHQLDSKRQSNTSLQSSASEHSYEGFDYRI